MRSLLLVCCSAAPNASSALAPALLPACKAGFLADLRPASRQTCLPPPPTFASAVWAARAAAPLPSAVGLTVRLRLVFKGAIVPRAAYGVPKRWALRSMPSTDLRRQSLCRLPEIGRGAVVSLARLSRACCSACQGPASSLAQSRSGLLRSTNGRLTVWVCGSQANVMLVSAAASPVAGARRGKIRGDWRHGPGEAIQQLIARPSPDSSTSVERFALGLRGAPVTSSGSPGWSWTGAAVGPRPPDGLPGDFAPAGRRSTVNGLDASWEA